MRSIYWRHSIQPATTTACEVYWCCHARGDMNSHDRTPKQALEGPERQNVLGPIKDDLQTWHRNGRWNLASHPTGVRTLPSGNILKLKHHSIRLKTRFRGHLTSRVFHSDMIIYIKFYASFAYIELFFTNLNCDIIQFGDSSGRCKMCIITWNYTGYW